MSTLADLRASVTLPPDALDLYGTFKDASGELLTASVLAYDMHDIKHRVPAYTLASVKAAATRVLTEIAKYEASK